MKLKEFLKLVRADEVINIYDPVKNEYLLRGISKEGVEEEYLHYKVVGINTNYNSGYDYDNAILEIDISEMTQR